MTDATQETVDVANPFVLEFTLQATDFHDEWERCNMLANYIAEYTAYQFDQRERAENLISTIANELLETAVSLTTDESTVKINITQDQTGLHVDTCYKIKPDLVDHYQTFVAQLGDQKFDQYRNLLTEKSDNDIYFNQLGLVMLSHDFGAQMSVKPIKSTAETCTTVTVANEEFAV